jgi:hypothetical protein
VKTAFGPARWATEIGKMLKVVFGPEHFPIDVIGIALQYTAQRFPGDAITLAQGADLPGFDGALYRAPAGKADGASSTTTPSPRQVGSISRLPTNSGTICCTAPIIRTAFAVASRMSFAGILRMVKSSTRPICLPPPC